MFTRSLLLSLTGKKFALRFIARVFVVGHCPPYCLSTLCPRHLISVSRPPSRPSLFFAALPLLCIILDANWWTHLYKKKSRPVYRSHLVNSYTGCVAHFAHYQAPSAVLGLIHMVVVSQGRICLCRCLSYFRISLLRVSNHCLLLNVHPHMCRSTWGTRSANRNFEWSENESDCQQ